MRRRSAMLLFLLAAPVLAARVASASLLQPDSTVAPVPVRRAAEWETLARSNYEKAKEQANKAAAMAR